MRIKAIITCLTTYVGGSSIFAPAMDWNISLWDPGNSFNSGDLMLDITKDANDNIQKASIYQFSSIVKGNYNAGSYDSGDYVHYSGNWYKAGASTSAAPALIPSVSLSQPATTDHPEAGMVYLCSGRNDYSGGKLKYAW